MVEEKIIEEQIPDQPLAAPTKPERRGGRGITAAVLLIGLGTALLLNNLGIVSINWLSLTQFWPIILILIGLDIMFGGRSVLGSMALAALGIALVVGAIVWSGVGRGVAPGNMITRPLQQELGDATDLKVNLELGAANADVRAEHGSKYALKGDYYTDERIQMAVTYDRNGSTGNLHLTQESDEFNNFSMRGGEINIGLTDAVPMNLSLNAGVGNATLDLTGIKLESLDINAGVGNVTITLPDSGSFSAKVDGGVGNVTITVPEGMEARVHYDSGISNLNIDKSRFHKVDDETWETSGYSSADNKVDIDVNAGIGNIEIN